MLREQTQSRPKARCDHVSMCVMKPFAVHLNRFATRWACAMGWVVWAGLAQADVDRDTAAAAATRNADGARVLAVDRAVTGERIYWRVKLLDAQGRVRVLRVDARTGQVF
ncbi:MAG: hypothetical protein OHK0048_07080 [Rhodoferax sp.]